MTSCSHFQLVSFTPSCLRYAELAKFCESVWGWNRRIYIHTSAGKKSKAASTMHAVLRQEQSGEPFLFLFSGSCAARTNELCLRKVVVLPGTNYSNTNLPRSEPSNLANTCFVLQSLSKELLNFASARVSLSIYSAGE